MRRNEKPTRKPAKVSPHSICNLLKSENIKFLTFSSHHLQQDESTQTQSEVEISDDKENNETKS